MANTILAFKRLSFDEDEGKVICRYAAGGLIFLEIASALWYPNGLSEHPYVNICCSHRGGHRPGGRNHD